MREFSRFFHERKVPVEEERLKIQEGGKDSAAGEELGLAVRLAGGAQAIMTEGGLKDECLCVLVVHFL